MFLFKIKKRPCQIINLSKAKTYLILKLSCTVTCHFSTFDVRESLSGISITTLFTARLLGIRKVSWCSFDVALCLRVHTVEVHMLALHLFIYAITYSRSRGFSNSTIGFVPCRRLCWWPSISGLTFVANMPQLTCIVSFHSVPKKYSDWSTTTLNGITDTKDDRRNTGHKETTIFIKTSTAQKWLIVAFGARDIQSRISAWARGWCV